MSIERAKDELSAEIDDVQGQLDLFVDILNGHEPTDEGWQELKERVDGLRKRGLDAIEKFNDYCTDGYYEDYGYESEESGQDSE